MNRLIVVGAGPAGLTLALQLARAGQPVTLIDARRDFARSLRGDALMPCGQEALARMGLWPLLEGLPQRRLQGWSVWIEGRQLFRVAEPLGALHPCRLVPQQLLLEALLQEALALPSFRWLPGVAVSGLLLGDGRMAGQPSRVRGVRLSDGRELEAELVIGCDGRDSAVRRAAGLTLQPVGTPLHLAWLVLPREALATAPPGAASPPAQGRADGELAGDAAKGMGARRGCVEPAVADRGKEVSRDGYPWISGTGETGNTGGTGAQDTNAGGTGIRGTNASDPGPGGSAAGAATSGDFLTLVAGGAIASACIGAGGELQLGWLLDPQEPLPERSAAAWAEAIARLAPPRLARLLRERADQLGRPQRFAVQVAQARHWQRPGVLLLGDAAHPMSPIRAQGINQALRDSLVAAQELLRLEPEPESLRDGHDALDRACRCIEARRRPEITRVQALQLAETRQGHWIGHHALLRQGLAWGARVLGPLARRVWTARQRPLREGAIWL